MNLTTILTKTLVHVHAILLHEEERCLDARKIYLIDLKTGFMKSIK